MSFLSIIVKGKEKTLYPSQEVSPEWESTISEHLVSFFKEKDAREGDILEKMLAKELESRKRKKKRIQKKNLQKRLSLSLISIVSEKF